MWSGTYLISYETPVSFTFHCVAMHGRKSYFLGFLLFGGLLSTFNDTILRKYLGLLLVIGNTLICTFSISYIHILGNPQSYPLPHHNPSSSINIIMGW